MHGNEGADDARACPSACGLNGRSFAFGRSVCPSLRAVCLAAAVLAVALGREDAGAGSTGGGGGLLSASSVTPSFSSFLSSSARCVKPLLRRLWRRRRMYLSGFALRPPPSSAHPCLQDACLRAQRRDGRGRAGGPLASLLPSNSRTYMASRPPPPTTVSVLLLGRQQFSSDSFFPPHFYQVQISCKLQIARGKGRRRRKRERGGGDGSGGGAKVNTGRRSCALNSQSRPRFVYIRPLDGGRDATQHDGGLRR